MHNSREAVEKVEHSAKSRFIDLRDKGGEFQLLLQFRYKNLLFTKCRKRQLSLT